jgi:hypothetical protein
MPPAVAQISGFGGCVDLIKDHHRAVVSTGPVEGSRYIRTSFRLRTGQLRCSGEPGQADVQRRDCAVGKPVSCRNDIGGASFASWPGLKVKATLLPYRIRLRSTQRAASGAEVAAGGARRRVSSCTYQCPMQNGAAAQCSVASTNWTTSSDPAAKNQRTARVENGGAPSESSWSIERAPRLRSRPLHAHYRRSDRWRLRDTRG